MTVQLRDRFLRVIVAGHFDKGEAARAPCGPVAHDRDGLDCTSLGKQCLEVVFGRFKRKVSNEEFATHVLLLRPAGRAMTVPRLIRCGLRAQDASRTGLESDTRVGELSCRTTQDTSSACYDFGFACATFR